MCGEWEWNTSNCMKKLHCVQWHGYVRFQPLHATGLTGRCVTVMRWWYWWEPTVASGYPPVSRHPPPLSPQPPPSSSPEAASPFLVMLMTALSTAGAIWNEAQSGRIEEEYRGGKRCRVLAIFKQNPKTRC